MAAGIPKRRADGGSFRDPAGRVYLVAAEDGGSRVVRGLDRTAAAAMGRLLAEPFFRRAMESGRVARTALLDAADPAARSVAEDGWAAAVEHEAVEFVTYPYEWSFSMLKDAALLQLSLVDEAARSGWLPKDATPFNVQWRGARPVFIDAPSFEPWRDGEYWRGYRQFCAMFLAPLLLTAHLGAPFQPLLRSALEGLPPEEAARYFYGRRVFGRGVLPHVLFPAWAERRARRRRRLPSRPRRQPKVLLFSLVDGLTRLVRGLSWRAPDSDWARYAERHSYGAEMAEKARFVDRHVSARRPRLIWDLGANTGVFSRVAARSARTVVAVDSDLGAVERLYARARSGVGATFFPWRWTSPIRPPRRAGPGGSARRSTREGALTWSSVSPWFITCASRRTCPWTGSWTGCAAWTRPSSWSMSGGATTCSRNSSNARPRITRITMPGISNGRCAGGFASAIGLR